MAIGQAAFLELLDGAAVVARWQDHWIGQQVTWEGQPWSYRQFDWGGIVSGQLSGQQGTITLPRTPSVLQLQQQALAGPWQARLRVYQCDETEGLTGPYALQQLTGTARGQIVGATGNLETTTWALGAAVETSAVQILPRIADTGLIGIPCQL